MEILGDEHWRSDCRRDGLVDGGEGGGEVGGRRRTTKLGTGRGEVYFKWVRSNLLDSIMSTSVLFMTTSGDRRGFTYDRNENNKLFLSLFSVVIVLKLIKL